MKKYRCIPCGYVYDRNRRSRRKLPARFLRTSPTTGSAPFALWGKTTLNRLRIRIYMSMFCFQCRKPPGRGCNTGFAERPKPPQSQDLLIYTLKGVSDIVVKGKFDVPSLNGVNYELVNSCL